MRLTRASLVIGTALLLAASASQVTTSTSTVPSTACGLDVSPPIGTQDVSSQQWLVASRPGPGLVPVHVVRRGSTDTRYVPWPAASRLLSQGYADGGVSFYASDREGFCSNVPVYEGTSPAGPTAYSPSRAALAQAGFTPSGSVFYAQVDKPTQLTATAYLNTASASWRAYADESDPAAKADFYQVAGTPTPTWFDGVSLSGDAARLSGILADAKAAGTVASIVLYGIPDRDCGGLAAGGQPSDERYRQWVDTMSDVIGDDPTVVFVEPDALSFCGSDAMRTERTQLLSYVADTFADHNPGALLYLHAGSGELDVPTTALALRDSGIAKMRGFALNIASDKTRTEEESWGAQEVAALSALGIAGAHYLIDTSRNGVGPQPNPDAPFEACNNMALALGVRPTPLTDDSDVDAYLWVKPPAETDGQCHPSDPAHGFFPVMARALVANSRPEQTTAVLTVPDDPSASVSRP